MDIKVFLIRIIACFILSILIGIERQYRHNLVGLRTNVLVSLGAFLFVYTSFASNINDKTRIAAQVVSGIGFLGAGVIIREGNKIKGLNTAATLWCVAAIGVLTASGMIIEASVGTFLVLLSNVFLRLISISIMDRIKKYQKEECTINISCKKDSEVVIRTIFSKYLENNSLGMDSLERSEITNDEVKLKAIIVTTRPTLIEDLVTNISAEIGVSYVSWKHEKLYSSDNEDLDDDE